MATLRSKAREHRLIKLPMNKLQEELFAIRSLNKLNKDLRNRAERLEKVIRIKEFLSISGLSIILIENNRPKRSFL